MDKLKAPTPNEAKTLSKLFGSGTSSREPFDPAAESVVLKRQKGKKCGIKRQRASKISVIMLDEFSPTLPRGKMRSKLASKGKIQSLQFTRYMSAKEVRSEIFHAFHIKNYFVLDLDNGGHNLVMSGNQKLTGDGVIDKNGSLYLCQKFEQVGACMDGQ